MIAETAAYDRLRRRHGSTRAREIQDLASRMEARHPRVSREKCLAWAEEASERERNQWHADEEPEYRR